MLVVRRLRHDCGPHSAILLLPLQPVERPAKDSMEGGGKGDGKDSTSPDDPGPLLGSVQCGVMGKSHWTEPQTGSRGLNGLGLDRSIYPYNFDIAFQPSTIKNMTHPPFSSPLTPEYPL